jgi:hypothetical protein
MLCSVKNRVIYLGVPHTASSWAHAQVENTGERLNIDIRVHHIEKHWRASDAIEFLVNEKGIDRQEALSFKVFVVVRHPVTWFASDWALKVREARIIRSHIDEGTFSELLKKYRSQMPEAHISWKISEVRYAEMGFDEYLCRSLRFNTNGGKGSLYERFNDNGSLSIEYLKYEDFEQTYTKIFQALGLDEMPDFNVVLNSSHWKKKDISAESIEKIAKYCKREFEIFEYDKHDFDVQDFRRL